MNFVDIGLFFLILLCAFLGWKNGVIKTSVRLVGIVVVAIIAYVFKTPLANFLIDFMPFLNFGGNYEDIYSINILFYNGVSFLFVFIMLYSILNILVLVAGILDKILKATIILYLPDKILGGLVGVLQGVFFSFVIIFFLVQLPQLQEYTLDSMYASRILNRTPIIRTALAQSTVISETINESYESYEDNKDKEVFEIDILNTLVKYGIITSEKVQELIDDEKLVLPGVKFE